MGIIKKVFKTVYIIEKKEKTPIYVVGGFVRDLLIGLEPTQDLDFVIEGSGIQFAKKFDIAMRQSGSLVEFPDFDTARYILKDGVKEMVVEFAGARAESYNSASRKPAVAAASIEADLSRRDFTINAMAVPAVVFAGLRWPSVAKIKSELVDPFQGEKDLAKKILRTPLDPDQTFSDDPLRVMRAVRFAAQLNFAIEPGALQSISNNRERLKIVSAERVREELFKLMACAQPSIGLFLMFQTRLMDLVLPEISKLDGVEEIYGHQHKNNLVHTFKVVDNIATRTDKVLLRWAGLFHDIGKPQTKKFMPKIGWTFHQHEHLGKKMVYSICRRLKFSKAETDYLAKLVRWHQQPISLMDDGITDSAVRRLVVNLGNELDDLLILGASDITTGNPYKLKKRQENYLHLRERVAAVMEKDKLRSFQSPFRGEEIMKESGLKAGPTVGKIKKAIEEAILDGIIANEYAAARGYFYTIKDQYLSGAKDWERI